MAEPTLRKGAKGQAVKDLQTALHELAYSVVADGVFGKKTEDAVKAFQEAPAGDTAPPHGRESASGLPRRATVRRLCSTETVEQCYGCVVKNITVSVPDGVYRDARIRAAERGRSVSKLVADFLASLSQQDAEFARLEAQQRAVLAEVERFSAGDRLARDEVHGRAVR